MELSLPFSDRGYTLDKEPVSTTNGELYFCTLNERKYVVKEFTTFRYMDGKPEELLPGARKQYDSAMAYLEFLKKVAQRLREVCRCASPLNLPMEVFSEKGHIYKVTRFVEASGIKTEEVHTRFKSETIDGLIASALLQLEQMQKARLVHGDLKPENLIITQFKRVFTVSIIDYDGGFFEGEAPQMREINFTPGYTAPEIQQLQMRAFDTAEEKNNALSTVTCASDMYSLACVWLHYLTGELPEMRVSENDSVLIEDLVASGLPYMPVTIDPARRFLIRWMMRPEPGRRPKPRELLDAINQARRSGLFREVDSALQGALPGFGWTLGKMRTPAGMYYREGDERGALRRVYILGQAVNAADEQGKPLPAWKEYQTMSGAARARLREIEKTVKKCAGKASTILPFRLREEGRMIYAIQEHPKLRLLTLRDFSHSFKASAAADALILRILAAVQALHDEKLMFGSLTEDCVFVFYGEAQKELETGESKTVRQCHIQLGCTFNTFLVSAIPSPDEWALPATLSAPEVGGYLGTADAGERAECKQYIGPRSDVFSLGLLYHLALCGELPQITEPCDGYIFWALGGDDALHFSDKIDHRRLEIIRAMTAYHPDARVESCQRAIEMIQALS